MKKIILSAILMGMLALGITTITEACPPNRILHINSEQSYRIRGRQPGNYQTIRNRLKTKRKMEKSRFVCVRPSPPKIKNNIHN